MNIQDIIKEHGIADQDMVSELLADGAVLTDRELYVLSLWADERRAREYDVRRLENSLNTEREQRAIERKSAVAAFEAMEQNYRQQIDNIKTYTEARYALLKEKYDAKCSENDELVIALDGKTASSKFKKAVSTAVDKVRAGVEKVGGDRTVSLSDTSVYIENMTNIIESDKNN